MTKMKLKIPFSPPDMSEEEAKEVYCRDGLRQDREPRNWRRR
jgi:hypothetical protein